MKKIIYSLFLISFFNLIFVCHYPLLWADNGDPGQTGPAPAKFLDYIFLRTEKIKEPASQCALLVDIAGAYIELGENEKSEQVLSKAIELAKNQDNQLVKSVLISGIIGKFIDLNKNETALNLIQYIDLEDSRADMLIQIASGYLQKNQYEKALELAQKIDIPSFRALAFYKIIEGLTTLQRFEELSKIQKIVQSQPYSVQRVIRLILREKNKELNEPAVSNLFASKSPSKKTKALIALAKDKIASGAAESASYILAEATTLSENIKGEYVKNECLAQIGICYVQIGELDKARNLAESIKIPFSRAELLSFITFGYVAINQFDAALKVIGSIDVQCFKEKALIRLIIRLIGQDKEQQANSIIKEQASASLRSRIYAAIIKNYLENNNYGVALALSNKIENPEIKMRALIEIAKELQKNKQSTLQLRDAFLESLALLQY